MAHPTGKQFDGFTQVQVDHLRGDSVLEDEIVKAVKAEDKVFRPELSRGPFTIATPYSKRTFATGYLKDRPTEGDWVLRDVIWFSISEVVHCHLDKVPLFADWSVTLELQNKGDGSEILGSS